MPQSTQTMVAAYNEFGIVRGCEKSSNSGYALKLFCWEFSVGSDVGYIERKDSGEPHVLA